MISRWSAPAAHVILGVLALVVTIGGLQPVRADQPASENPEAWRDVGKIEFVGNTVFPGDELRQALSDDPEFQFASLPPCSLEKFQQLLEQRLTTGYHLCGYSKPKIVARRNDQTSLIVVEVDAGQQYHEGRLKVTGSSHVSVQTLEEWILNPRPKAGSCRVDLTIGGKRITQWVDSTGSPSTPHAPLWEPNDRVSFHPPNRESVRKEISRCCETLGYFDAKVTAVLREEDDGTVTLVVEVQDEGPQAHLDEITIVGLKRNQPEELIEFLNLQKGMPITGTLHAEIQRKLFESGKYLESKLKFQKTAESKVSLRIDVYENELASTLKQPKSNAEEAACRLAAWVNKLSEISEDIIIESKSDPELRVIWSTRDQELFAEYAGRRRLDGRIDYGLAVHADSSGVDISALHCHEKLSIPRLDSQVTIQIIGKTHRPDKRGHTERLLMGTGFRTVMVGQMPVAAIVVMPPALAIRGFLEKGRQVTFEKDRVICSDGKSRLEMDFETGRLIECEICDDELFGTIRISTGVNHLRSAIEEYRQRVEQFTSVYEPERPFTSLVRFGLNLIDPVYWNSEVEVEEDVTKTDASGDQVGVVVSDQDHSVAGVEELPDAEKLCRYWKEIGQIERGLQVARKFLKPETMQPFDHYLLSVMDRWLGPKGKKFLIPPENDRNYTYLTVQEIEKAAAALCSRDSWGYRIAHHWNMSANNQRNPEAKIIPAALVTDAEFEKFGPVAAYYSTLIGSFANNPQNGNIAIVALRCLTLENVKQDAEQLLSPTAPLTRVVEGLLTTIAECSPEEWDDIAYTMFPEQLRSFAIDAHLLCRKQKENSLRSVSELIERIYPDFIEPALRSHFESLEASSGK